MFAIHLASRSESSYEAVTKAFFNYLKQNIGCCGTLCEAGVVGVGGRL